MKSKLFMSLIGILAFISSAVAQDNSSDSEKVSWKERVFTGGGFGLSFGNVDLVEVSPLVGYRITENLSAGVGFTYRYRNDKRFTPNFESSDYGGRLFTRYNIVQPFFLQLEYEYLNYALVRLPDLEQFRDSFSSFLAGGGMAQPIGRNSFVTFTALYNLSYTSGDLTSPYDSPWVIRAGINVGF